MNILSTDRFVETGKTNETSTPRLRECFGHGAGGGDGFADCSGLGGGNGFGDGDLNAQGYGLGCIDRKIFPRKH